MHWREVSLGHFASYRYRSDLLEVFKIINGLDGIFPADFFFLWKMKMAKQEGTLTKYTNYTLGLIYESILSLN